MNDLIKIEQINNVDVVDSRLIAQELGIQHHKLIETIRKYETELQGFGTLTLERETCKHTTGASVSRFYYLNEDQATFVMALSRNTKKVVALKVKLVTSFAKAKNVINKQSDRIKELQLELELEKQKALTNQKALQAANANQKLLATVHAMETFCPGLAPLAVV